MAKARKWAAAHRKFLVALAGAVLSVAGLAFPHAQWLPVVIAAATAAGVHQVPNRAARPPGSRT